MNCFMPTVETERLILRPIRLTDAEDLYQIGSDPEVNQYLLYPLHTSVENTRAFIEKEWLYLAGNDMPEVLVLEDKKTHKMIGTCNYTSVKGNDIAEIGYSLNSHFWNQGLMSEALQKVIEIGFTTLGLRRIEIVHSVYNKRSQRVIEKAGFVYEGTYRRYVYDKTVNEMADCRFYSLLKEEWEAK